MNGKIQAIFLIMTFRFGFLSIRVSHAAFVVYCLHVPIIAPQVVRPV